MTLQDQAEQNVQQARLLYENGRREQAILLQRRGALQYALAMRDVELPAVEAWWAPNPDGPWQDLGTVFSVPEPPPARVDGSGFTGAASIGPGPSA